MYPQKRLQRYRRSTAIRELVCENRLHPSQFILPLFISELISDTSNKAQPIAALPGVVNHNLKTIIIEVSEAIKVGINAVILFGIPNNKTEDAKAAYDGDGIVQRAIHTLKQTFPELIIIADCCLCEYTSDGHCGIMTDQGIAHEETLVTLQKIAVSYAHAGVDIIAPSGMMDGMVGRIRSALDLGGYHQVAIMSYAVKYASHFYGPFRDAAGSTQFSGDRHHHQLSPTQCKEGVLEAQLDDAEGADFLMVKPAGFYMDMIQLLSQQSQLPIVAYHVSGEYAMVQHAADAGAIKLIPALLEIYMGMKRAGAQLIISYAAKEVAASLQQATDG